MLDSNIQTAKTVFEFFFGSMEEKKWFCEMCENKPEGERNYLHNIFCQLVTFFVTLFIFYQINNIQYKTETCK